MASEANSPESANRVLAEKLFAAIRKEKTEDVEKYLCLGADPNYVVLNGHSPFHIAAGCKRSEHFVNLMLKYDGDPNVRNDEGLTPLHIAASWGKVNCMSLLAENGANACIKDRDGRDIKWYAQENGSAECIRLADYLLKEIYIPMRTPKSSKLPRTNKKIVTGNKENRKFKDVPVSIRSPLNGECDDSWIVKDRGAVKRQRLKASRNNSPAPKQSPMPSTPGNCHCQTSIPLCNLQQNYEQCNLGIGCSPRAGVCYGNAHCPYFFAHAIVSSRNNCAAAQTSDIDTSSKCVGTSILENNDTNQRNSLDINTTDKCIGTSVIKYDSGVDIIDQKVLNYKDAKAATSALSPSVNRKHGDLSDNCGNDSVFEKNFVRTQATNPASAKETYCEHADLANASTTKLSASAGNHGDSESYASAMDDFLKGCGKFVANEMKGLDVSSPDHCLSFALEKATENSLSSTQEATASPCREKVEILNTNEKHADSPFLEEGIESSPMRLRNMLLSVTTPQRRREILEKYGNDFFSTQTEDQCSRETQAKLSNTENKNSSPQIKSEPRFKDRPQSYSIKVFESFAPSASTLPVNESTASGITAEREHEFTGNSPCTQQAAVSPHSEKVVEASKANEKRAVSPSLKVEGETSTLRLRNMLLSTTTPRRKCEIVKKYGSDLLSTRTNDHCNGKTQAKLSSPKSKNSSPLSQINNKVKHEDRCQRFGMKIFESFTSSASTLPINESEASDFVAKHEPSSQPSEVKNFQNFTSPAPTLPVNQSEAAEPATNHESSLQTSKNSMPVTKKLPPSPVDEVEDSVILTPSTENLCEPPKTSNYPLPVAKSFSLPDPSIILSSPLSPADSSQSSISLRQFAAPQSSSGSSIKKGRLHSTALCDDLGDPQFEVEGSFDISVIKADASNATDKVTNLSPMSEAQASSSHAKGDLGVQQQSCTSSLQLSVDGNDESSQTTVIYNWKSYWKGEPIPQSAKKKTRNKKSAKVAESRNSVSVAEQSSLENLEKLTDSEIRQKLLAFNVNPGPIALCRNAYLKKLDALLKNSSQQNSALQHSTSCDSAADTSKQNADCAPPKFSVDLNRYVLGIRLPDSVITDDEAIRQQFEQPDPNTSWREGTAKDSFTYLLLDPRVTDKLPVRAKDLSELEIFKSFAGAIFYVGKGKQYRPYYHFSEALQANCKTHPSQKVQHILSIWESDLGVVSLHVYQSVIACEAYTREAAMIDALGLGHLTNCKRGDYYGTASSWTMPRKRKYGTYLLKKALEVLMVEGERQIKPSNLRKNRKKKC